MSSKELIAKAYQFQVSPQPGKLLFMASQFKTRTIYIENVNSGSQFKDNVQMGDVIVSIDGVNVTTMTACELAKWIRNKPDGVETIVFATGIRLYNYVRFFICTRAARSEFVSGIKGQ